jgi:hypothetical protein
MGPLFDSARLRRSRHLDFGYVSRPNLQSSDASCAAYDLHGPLNSVRVELKGWRGRKKTGLLHRGNPWVEGGQSAMLPLPLEAADECGQVRRANAAWQCGG